MPMMDRKDKIKELKRKNTIVNYLRKISIDDIVSYDDFLSPTDSGFWINSAFFKANESVLNKVLVGNMTQTELEEENKRIIYSEINKINNSAETYYILLFIEKYEVLKLKSIYLKKIKGKIIESNSIDFLISDYDLSFGFGSFIEENEIKIFKW